MAFRDLFNALSDEALISETKRLTLGECAATAKLIAALAEIDERRLYLGQGCSSLFTYCTQVLGLSEHSAYGRIEAARAAAKFPQILDLLANGSINLTTVGLVGPHLTEANQHEVLSNVSHKTKREVEQFMTTVRHGADAAPETYRMHLTVSRETFDKLRRAQDLLRHAIPDGDAGQIFDRALTLLLSDLEGRKLAATERPRAAPPPVRHSRNVPAHVKREVWARDGGRCAFVGAEGRCRETGFLEFHHVVPFADGGKTTAANLQLRCRAHNAFEAERWSETAAVT